MDLNVLPECYIDTKLVKALVPPQGRYNHQKGTNVLKVMDEKMAGEFALGIVDEDVLDRAYPQKFDSVYYLPNSLKLLKHPQRSHFLICLCPEAEKWIIATAEAAGLSLAEFGLPNDINKLSKITKTSKSENDDPFSNNFKQLFRAFREQNSVSVTVLTFWISHLKTNPYQPDLDFLREETERLLSSQA